MGDVEEGEQAADTEEVARLRAELDRANAKLAGRRGRVRSVTVAILVVLTSLSVVLAGLAAWLHETLLDTERFMETVTPVFSEQVVTDALGRYLTDQSFEALSVEDRVAATLSRADDFIEQQVLGMIDLNPRVQDRIAAIDRPRFEDLAVPLVQAAQDSVEQSVQEYLESEEFQRTFAAIASRGHESAVALLRGEYERLPNVVVDEQSVRIDLTPAVVGVIQRAVVGGVGFIGFEPPAAFATEVETPAEAQAWLADVVGFDAPAGFAQVTVMSAERLDELQGALRSFDRLVWLLVALVIVLGVSAVWLSDHKGRTVVQLGVGVALASLLGGLAVRRLEQVVVAAFGDAEGREAARLVIARTVSTLQSIGIVVIAVSLLVAVVSFAFSQGWHVKAAAWVAGEHGSSRLDALIVDHFDALRIVGAVVALAVLWITGIELWPVLVVGLALSGYLLVLATLRTRVLSDDDESRVEEHI